MVAAGLARLSAAIVTLNERVASTPVTERLTALNATDDFVVLRGGAPYLVAANVVAAYAGGSPAATEPAAFTAGQWTADATATPGEISFNLDPLPADGGSPITALEYRVGTGAEIAFVGTGAGVRVVTAGLTAGAAADLQVRAVNAVDPGPWSDIKNRTPLAAGGGGTAEIASTGSSQPGYGDPRTAPVPAGAATGDRLLIVFAVGAAVVGVVDDEDTGYSALAIPSAGANDRVYLSDPLGEAIPTVITVDMAGADWIEKADVYVLTGASAVVVNHGVIDTGWSTDPRAHNYTTTGANEFVFGSLSFTGGGVTGAGSADGDHAWSLNAAGGGEQRFAVVRPAEGNYGATLAPLGAGSPSSGFWFSLAAAA